MSASPFTSLPPLDRSLGAIEVGFLISTLLYGVTTVQVYLYYSQGTIKDPLRVRILVPFVWVVETLQTAFSWYSLYRLTVTYYGQPEIILQGHWSLNTSALFDGIVGALVQGFFAYRIYYLTKKWYITVISWIGSLCGLGGTMAILILSQTDRLPYIAPAVTTTLVCLVFVDLVNTISLCTLLRLGRRDVSRNTDEMLKKLFLWTMETGLITSLAGILMLVLSLAYPDTYLWICVSLFYARLYSNSLMASLNGREFLRSELNASQGLSTLSRNTGTIRVATLQPASAHSRSDADDLEMSYMQDTFDDKHRGFTSSAALDHIIIETGADNDNQPQITEIEIPGHTYAGVFS